MPQITDEETALPFAGAAITADTNVNVTVEVTFPDERGSFPEGGGLEKTAPGTYRLENAAPEDAAAFLDDLEFTPDSHRLADAEVETTAFTVIVSDASGSATNSINVEVTGVNENPAVSFGSSPLDIFDNETSQPFAAIVISDADGDPVSVRIEFPKANGNLPESGDLTRTGNVYELTARAAGDAQSFLRALTFTPTENRIPVTESEATTFSVTVTDSAGAEDSDSEALDVHSFNDPPHFTVTVPAQINDNQAAALFKTISVTDPDVARSQGSVVAQSVTAVAEVPGVEGAIAFGSFPSLSLTFSASGSPADVTSELRAVPFTPVSNRTPVGEEEAAEVSIVVMDSLGEPAPENGAKNFNILSINDPPEAVVSLFPAAFPDDADVLPFRLSISDPDPFDNAFTAELLPVSDPAFQFGALEPAAPSFSGTPAFIAVAVQNVFYKPVRNGAAGNQEVEMNFKVTDPHGASVETLATLTLQGVNDPPVISGVPVSLIRVSDDESVSPFSSVTIADPDGQGEQKLTVTVELDDPGKGTLTLAGPFENMTSAEATAAIRGVTFTPAAGRIPVGETETLVLTITVTDSGGLSRSNDQATIVVTSINGAPIISGVPPAAEQPLVIPPAPPIEPFSQISIEDDDDPPSVTVTVSIDDTAKGVLTNLAGFTEQPADSGQYVFTGAPSDVTAALADLQFQPNPDYLFPPNNPGGTTFTIKAVDSVLNTRTETLSIVLQSLPRNHLVTRIDDDLGEGSLRHAIGAAGNDDVITFALESYPAVIQLDEDLGPLELVRNLTLKGPGADMLTISGDSDGNRDPDVQLFRVSAAVTMEGLALTKGAAGTGGAVYVGPGGQLTMRFCAVTDSRALQWGGGIDVDEGSLRLEHCFLRGNATDAALGLGGGAVSLFTEQPCAFINTTFSGNQQLAANGFGGGAIYAENFAPERKLFVDLLHCTFAENQDAAGAGSSIHANVFGTLIRARNSIFADGRDNNLEVAGAARIVSLGGNVSDDSTRTILTQGGQPKLITLLDQSTDATEAAGILAPLNPRSRPTPVYPLAGRSPASGRAMGIAEAIDQRGAIRGGNPDSGAAEFGARGRITINEIQAKGIPADFIELYVLRDSVPVDLSEYSVWVDGVEKHTFAANTIIEPGFGIIVADTAIDGDGTAVAPAGSPLELGKRGRVELRAPGGALVLAVDYVDIFVDPANSELNLDFPDSSLTLAPQFRGFAYLPHSRVLPPPLGGGDLDHTGDTVSPGADTGNTRFGSPNAFPFAVADRFLAGEDDLLMLPVLDNDLDADGAESLRVVDVSQAAGTGGDDGSALTAAGAEATVEPPAATLLGTAVGYDPRAASALQQLPEGVEETDRFYYSIVDAGVAVTAYEGAAGVSPAAIVSPGHRLITGDQIVIIGSSTASYNGVHAVTRIDDDRFSIPVAFADDPAKKGAWTMRSETEVVVTVIGANDPPAPLADTVETDEETILRILGDEVLTPAVHGSVVNFDTDSIYPRPRQISDVSLLANDSDIDADDDHGTLKIIGVLGSIVPITDYSGTAGAAPVVVESPGHGLADGARILISGYGGHPSYNGYHEITVLDEDQFSIPELYVDNHAAKGSWVILNDGNRLAASSARGAEVSLEIRADRVETSIVYNPRASAYLNGLAVTENEPDTFYYAVMDSHGAISLGQVTVNVQGVNDTPLPSADPGSLGLLDELLAGEQPLGGLLGELDILFNVRPASGLLDHTDAQVEHTLDGQALSFFLTDLWSTDEESAILIPLASVLTNDSDIDRINVLSVADVAPSSREGAAVAIQGDSIKYDPVPSSRLQMLAREEPLIDSFEVTVSDGTDTAVATVAVLVVGLNDTPEAQDDGITTPIVTPEDTVLVLSPPGPVLDNDLDKDIDGSAPDNQLRIIPVEMAPTQVEGAHLTIADNVVTYDPSGSAYFNGLAQGETFVDRYVYTVWDGSFVFANDDIFKVRADGSDFVLDILSNDRNLTGFPGTLSIVEVGAPSSGGTAVLDASGTRIIYTPEVNFVGDEVLRYTVADQFGNTDGALVAVRVTVNQLNGNLQANADHFTMAAGETPVLDVLANDNIIPAAGGGLTITRIVSQPGLDAVTLADNRITYHQDVEGYTGTYPYTTTFSYEVTGGGTSLAVAEVTVQVVDRRGTLFLRDDSFSVQAGTTGNPLDVLANDNILPGSPFPLTILEVSGLPAHGTVQTNEAGNILLYTPDEGFVGEDAITYIATDLLGGTGTGEILISVGQLTVSGDFFAVPFDASSSSSDDGSTELDVLANDRVLQSAGNTITVTGAAPADRTQPSLGSISIAPDGSGLLFDPDPDKEGEQEFIYTLRDETGRSAEGKVTVIVASEGVKANPDYFSVGAGSSANELNILVNDRAIPDRGRPLTIIGIGTGLNAPNHGGTVTVNETNDRLVYTPAPGFVGEETFTYMLTDSRQTDVAKVVVRVSTGALLAANDAFTVFYAAPPASSEPPPFTLAVLGNDRVLPDNGQVLTITGVGIDHAPVSNAPDMAGKVEISPDGASLLYIPSGPGVEHFTYEVSDGTARRASARVTIEVLERADAREMETNDDAFTVERDSTGNVLRVLANDGRKPASALGWRITSVAAPIFGGVAAVSGQAIFYTPAPGFVGTDEFDYTVSDGQGGTGQARVRIKVGDLPVSQDFFSVVTGTIGNAFDVLVNDAIRPDTAAGYELVSVVLNATGTPRDGVLTLDAASGMVLYTPSLAYAGPYPYFETFSYVLEDDSGHTVSGLATVAVHQEGSDRDPATLAVTVAGVNDLPVIAGTVAGQTVYERSTLRPFAGVTITEVDSQGLEPLAVTVTLDSSEKGFIYPLGIFQETGPGTYHAAALTAAEATAALRALHFVPTTADRVSPDSAETTTLALSVQDPFAPAVVDNQTTVIAIHPFSAAITSIDEGLPSDRFGQPVAVSGDLLVVGVPSDKHGHPHPDGSVYVYGRNKGGPDNWGLLQMIMAPEGEDDDRFGYSVAVSGGLIAAGTPGKNYEGFNSGSVYLYQRNPGTDSWSLVKELAPSGLDRGDEFGHAVALSGDTLAVGSPESDGGRGAAYIFVQNEGGAGNWGQVHKISPPDASRDDKFGYSVSLDGGLLAAGAPNDDDEGSLSLFHRNFNPADPASPIPNNWGRVAKLTPEDAGFGDNFGASVAVDGLLVAGGAPNHGQGWTGTGAVYVYSGETGSWELLKKLVPDDAQDEDQFGSAVSLDRNVLVAGARRDDDVQTDAGTAYVYGRNYNPANPAEEILDNWAQIEKFRPAYGRTEGHFGFSVAVNANTVAVGSDFEGWSTPNSTYVYRLKYNNAPLLTVPLLDQVAVAGESFLFVLPPSAFVDADYADSLVLSATMVDGSPLPAWLGFDPLTGTFSGTASAADVGSVSIMVTATDLDAGAVSDIFSTGVNETAVVRLRILSVTAAATDPLGYTSRFEGGNFAAYAFGQQDAAAELPLLELEVRESASGTHRLLAFTRRANDPGLKYVIERSADLVKWEPAGEAYEEMHARAINEDFERVTFLGSSQGDSAPKMEFLRVRALLE